MILTNIEIQPRTTLRNRPLHLAHGAKHEPLTILHGHQPVLALAIIVIVINTGRIDGSLGGIRGRWDVRGGCVLILMYKGEFFDHVNGTPHFALEASVEGGRVSTNK
jgi:hypothetical protein